MIDEHCTINNNKKITIIIPKTSAELILIEAAEMKIFRLCVDNNFHISNEQIEGVNFNVTSCTIFGGTCHQNTFFWVYFFIVKICNSSEQQNNKIINKNEKQIFNYFEL